MMMLVMVHQLWCIQAKSELAVQESIGGDVEIFRSLRKKIRY
jgi:hypothetical protein